MEIPRALCVVVKYHITELKVTDVNLNFFFAR